MNSAFDLTKYKQLKHTWVIINNNQYHYLIIVYIYKFYINVCITYLHTYTFR